MEADVNPRVGAESDVTRNDEEARRVVLSSFLGTTVEYYDFLLYGTAAALVFGPVFFPELSGATALFASLMTFAAGYVARPVGGVIFGHYGDRIGRKKMLLVSLTMMGVSSTAIGLIPSADMIGAWAAVILVTLRLIQGIAVGGEWGGAALMALEHAAPHRRGFYASFTNAGAPMGGVLATVAMLAFATLPEEDFLAWGWRIPFLLSAVLLGIGLFVRMRVAESPIFRAAVQKAETERPGDAPLAQVLKAPATVLVAGGACLISFAMQASLTTFGIGYAVESGTERTSALWGLAAGSLIAIFTVLGYARLSDAIGRRPVMIGGCVGVMVLAYPIFSLLGAGGALSYFFAFLLFNICQNAIYGPMAAFLTEQFNTRSRYTGASLGYQLAALGGGFAPAALVALNSEYPTTPAPMAIFMIALAAVSAVLIFITKESRTLDLTH
jgi:MFS family permease